MNRSFWTTAVLVLSFFPIACGGKDDDDAPGGTGGSATGGSSATGGTPRTGGTQGSDAGSPATTGGRASTGGTDVGGAPTAPDPSPCLAPTGDALIDDFEDGDLMILPVANRTSEFYSFDDGTANAVFSLSNEPAGDRRTLFASAMGFLEYGAGFGTNLEESGTAVYDVSAYEGLTFCARAAEPVEMRVSVSVPASVPEGNGPGTCVEPDPAEVTCYNHPSFVVEIGPDWETFTIPWADLAQADGWGQPAEFDPTLAYQVQFQNRTDATDFQVWIDYLAFYGSGQSGVGGAGGETSVGGSAPGGATLVGGSASGGATPVGGGVVGGSAPGGSTPVGGAVVGGGAAVAGVPVVVGGQAPGGTAAVGGAGGNP